MRLLHTSDWHLGRSLHGQPLLDAQAAFIDFLVEVVPAEGIDAVVVAGDLYDRAIPPLDAVSLFDEALARLHALGVPMVLISGNHDSAGRLAFASGLLDAAGVHVRSRPGSCGQPVVLADPHGEVVVYPLPYLEPTLCWAGLEATEPRHQAVLDAAMARVRADLTTRAGARSVVVAHAFVAGAEPCDSERDVSVGGTSAVAMSTFEGVDYVALGHLHRPQSVADHIAYSGSPLAYSFSEAGQTKAVSLVSLPGSGRVSVEHVATPVPRPLVRLRGELDDLLTADRWTEHEGAWLEITLTDAARPVEPMQRLRQRFPGVLRLIVESAAGTSGDGGYLEQLTGRTDLEVCEAFVEHVRGAEASDAERALLDAALQAQRAEAVA